MLGKDSRPALSQTSLALQVPIISRTEPDCILNLDVWVILTQVVSWIDLNLAFGRLGYNATPRGSYLRPTTDGRAFGLARCGDPFRVEQTIFWPVGTVFGQFSYHNVVVGIFGCDFWEWPTTARNSKLLPSLPPSFPFLSFLLISIPTDVLSSLFSCNGSSQSWRLALM